MRSLPGTSHETTVVRLINGKIVFILVDLANVLKLCDRVQLHPHGVAASAPLNIGSAEKFKHNDELGYPSAELESILDFACQVGSK